MNLNINKYVVFGMLAMTTVTSAMAWAKDEWHGQDKVKHIEASMAASMVASLALAKFFPENAGYIETFALGMVPGIVREATKPNPSYQDLAADAIGAAIGTYIGVNYIAKPLFGLNGKFTGVSFAYQSNYK